MKDDFPPLRRFEEAMQRANAILRDRGRSYPVTAEDLMAWLQTDTPYPNPTPCDLLDNAFLVIHEIVEIDSIRRMGLVITKDVIVKNMEKVNVAHLAAARVEFDVAASYGDVDYLRSRFQDLQGWCEDPLLSAPLRLEYESFRRETERTLARLARARAP